MMAEACLRQMQQSSWKVAMGMRRPAARPISISLQFSRNMQSGHGVPEPPLRKHRIKGQYNPRPRTITAGASEKMARDMGMSVDRTTDGPPTIPSILVPRQVFTEGMEDLPGPFWGMAIYRTTYKDNQAWEAYLQYLRSHSVVNPDTDGRPEGTHAFQLFDHPALEGVGLRQVRHLFSDEIAQQKHAHAARLREVMQELCRLEGRRVAAKMPVKVFCEATTRAHFATAAHNYCLMVDETCLDPRHGQPVAKLLRRTPVGRWEAKYWKQDEENEWMYLPLSKYVECVDQLHNHKKWPRKMSSRWPVFSSSRGFEGLALVWAGRKAPTRLSSLMNW
ncbi:hypothetical protein PG984_013092 [Apiospora sp. TS-2023a]